MTRVAVAGALGKMGTLVIQDLAKAADMQLVAGFDAVGAGKTLLGGILVTDAKYLESKLVETKPDVLVDFTVAAASVENICTAARLGINLVVGTTGFSSDQNSQIKTAIDGNVAAVITPNFSVGVNIFWNLVSEAAKALKDYDIEIIEAHHNQKRDAPSGTALATVEVIKKALGEMNVLYGRKGMGLRDKEIGVHAVRGGDIVGDHTVLFAGSGERLEIKHQAHSRTALSSGAVKATRWVVGKDPGIYDMKDVLGLR